MSERRSERDLNQLDGFRDFIRSWEDVAHPSNRDPVALFHTEFGNINSTGDLGDYRGYALSRWHPQFGDSLEGGIKQLVLLVTSRFGWVTYSSCEGHRYRGRGLRSVERHVGIVPRSDAEQAATTLILAGVAAEANRRGRGTAVFVEVRGTTLEADGRAYPVIDLIFRRRRTWERYFGEIDGVYAHVLDLLAAHAPAPGNPDGAATPPPPASDPPSA